MQKFNYQFPLKDDEKIVHKELANMHDSDYVLNGALYLTNQRIVFIALVPKSNTKVTYTILLSNVKDVIPEKSLFFFNNILRIVSTLDEQYKFVVKGQKEWQMQILQQISQKDAAAANQG